MDNAVPADELAYVCRRLTHGKPVACVWPGAVITRANQLSMRSPIRVNIIVKHKMYLLVYVRQPAI